MVGAEWQAAYDLKAACMVDYGYKTLRWVSGPAGLLVIALSFRWMDWFGVPYDKVPGMLGGAVIFLGTMLGVYLLFYALTGDWLPKLSKGARGQ